MSVIILNNFGLCWTNMAHGTQRAILYIYSITDETHFYIVAAVAVHI